MQYYIIDRGHLSNSQVLKAKQLAIPFLNLSAKNTLMQILVEYHINEDCCLLNDNHTPSSANYREFEICEITAKY